MNRRLWELLEELSEEKYRTSAQLGEQIGISEKTVRTRINELNGEITRHGAEIISKPRYGYYLYVTDQKEWKIFQESKKKKQEGIPEDSEERIDYLLAMFLNRNSWQKTEELSEFLYVSPKTLSNEIKKVEYILSKFSLRLERRSHYGIRIAGDEFNKRKCILRHFYLSSKAFWEIHGEQEQLSIRIADHLKKLAISYRIKFSETAFQETVLYFYVSITRMKRGIYIENEKKDYDTNAVEVRAARDLYEMIHEKENWIPTDTEIQYAGIYIAGKRFIGGETGIESNFVISEKTDQLVMKILDSIYETYQVEFRDNLNLRMMLNQHMIPLGIRLRYGISIENWDNYEIKDKYMFAYTMAQQAASVISEEYKKEVSESEIACLAVYFELGLEEAKSKGKRKKNILLVCVSGKASSRMLIYRFRREFEEYIQSLQVCGMYDFDNYDLSGIDFIFSTVPIYKKVSVPIMEIHDFLEAGEIMSVRHFLEVGATGFLDQYYKKKYFFSDIEAKDREDAIRQLCMRLRNVTELPEGFEDSVMQREMFGPTDFGNLTAIPHPCKIMTKETIVAVAVLKEKILWSSQYVQVIVLTSLSEAESEDIRRFYDVTSSFLMNEEAVLKLIRTPEFEQLQILLKNMDIPKK